MKTPLLKNERRKKQGIIYLTESTDHGVLDVFLMSLLIRRGEVSKRIYFLVDNSFLHDQAHKLGWGRDSHRCRVPTTSGREPMSKLHTAAAAPILCNPIYLNGGFDSV